MKKIHVLFVLWLILLTLGCNRDESLIKKDLDSRFTKFEIVEIRKDSSTVKDAIMRINSLMMRTAKTNLEIVKVLNGIDLGIRTPYQNYLYIDSLHNSLLQSFQKFEDSRFDKVDPCYYVKYLVHKEEIKIPKEEYYYISESGNVWNRPYDWDEFLLDRKYDVLIKEALQYHGEIFDLERKFSKK